jgi:muramoyltetrapeptide carboxypeptidase
MINPPSLRAGDRIAVISPATTVKEEYVRGAETFLRSAGFMPVVMPSALGPADGSYAASGARRLSDLLTALADDDVRCILCARGGYGCVHLLDGVDASAVAAHPKWLVGFSDISALHALWQKAGVMSLHAPMAKHLATSESDDAVTESMISILTGKGRMDYRVAPSPYNRSGRARGRLRGGNLAVLNSLAATPYDILTVNHDEDVILFVEDISEAIYAVERMLTRLWLSGTLSRIKGLIIGRFTEYKPDRNFNSMEEMADALLTRYGISGIPVAFEFPVGHVPYNLPLIEGEEVDLSVMPGEVTLKSV